MSDFPIRPYAYTDEDSAKLAAMWNESDDQWPGTFTGGVPLTSERVREWMDRETGLAILVVDDPTKRLIVGYGSLWDEHDKENVCYVAVLNVQPAYQGKSLARRMLTQMIDRSVELGYHQMDIATWPGNLKSVPLYKKVGFFWVPDTNVHMENYVPLIRQMPAAQSYFQKHDWFATFKRELLQIEDDERRGAMNVYGYHWAESGDKLSVWIDREAKAPAGVETHRLAVFAELDEVEPAHGLAYPIRWRVTNKRAEPVNVSILASGDPGVEISHQASFLLDSGEERVLEGHFTVSPDVAPVKKDWPATRIKSVLVVDGEVVELSAGVRSRPAIAISTEPAHPVLVPGQPGKVQVQLHNHLDRPLRGTVSMTPEPGCSIDWAGSRHDFDLGVKEYAGIPLTVTCEKAGTVPLRFTASFEVNGNTVRTRPERYPVFSLAPGGVVADIGHRGDEGLVILIENEFFRLRCRAEGGRCEVWDKVSNRLISSVREELGPPFVPSELWYKTYDLSLTQEDGQKRAILRARSANFPGLVFIKELAVSASPLMTLRYKLLNEGDQAHAVQLNPCFWMGEMEQARITLPRVERLVRERAALFSSTYGDVPEKPDGMAEEWLAWRVNDFSLGLIWGDDVEAHKWEWSAISFDRSTITLEPGSVTEMQPFYVYAGPGDWANVRRAWQRSTGQPQELTGAHDSHTLLGRKLEFGFDPSPVISTGDPVEATLRVDSVRELALDGRMVVEAPNGWQAKPDEFVLENLKHERPLVTQVRFEGAAKPAGATSGKLHLESSRFDVTEPFTLIRLGDQTVPVRVGEKVVRDQTLFTVDNGHSLWKIAPDYHAGVVGWHEGESDVNHMYCAFPQKGGATLGWLKPWFGGIQPILTADGGDEEEWPGKLHEETFKPLRCERTDDRGITWQGLRLTARIKRETFRGLRAEVEYLTVGRSNLLKVIYRLVNETGVYWRVRPGLLIFCQVDGRYDNATLYGDGIQRKRTPTMMWTVVEPWGAVTNPESGRTIVAVKGTHRAELEISDWGQDGGHFTCQQRTVVRPHSQGEMVVYLALAGSLEEARCYGALGV